MDKSRKALYPMTSELDDVITELSKAQSSLHEAMNICNSCEFDLSHDFDEKEGKPIIVPIPEDALRTIAFCRQVIKDGLASTKDLINAAMTATTMIDGVVPATTMRSTEPQAK